jgi:DNA-binding CsgD family transcriptional regulator
MHNVQTMLTDEQKKLITKGLSRGVADTQIAEAIGVKHMQVFNYRKSLGISAQDVVEARYDTWIRMLEAGMSVDLVASLYKVKPESVLNSLYRKRKFSYTEAKKRGQKAIEAGFRKAMGLSVQDLQEQRLQAWVRLFESGMTVEAIADIYHLKPSTVRNALRKATDVTGPVKSATGTFDW